MRFSSLRVVLGFASLFLWLVPSIVFAGNCVRFCRNMTPRLDGSLMVTYAVGNACSSAADCTRLPECPSGTSNASLTQVNEFCTDGLSLLNAAEMRESMWCHDYTNTDHSRTYFDDAKCLIIPSTAGPAPISHPTVQATPVPAPAHPGDQFRCRFLCAGDTQARNGDMCSAANDQRSCIQECVRTCGPRMAPGDGCMGLGPAGTPDGRNTDQEPQCIPTTGPTASEGGITDTQRIETINESFATLSIPAFIGNMVRALLGVAGALFFAMLIWGGIQWMTAGGESAQVKSAQTTTRNAIIGVAIIALSYTMITAFMQLIAGFAGLTS